MGVVAHVPQSAARRGPGRVLPGVALDARERSARLVTVAVVALCSLLAGALEEAGYQGEWWPDQAAVAGDGVGPQFDVWGGQGKEAHSLAGGVAEWKQPDAQASCDHVLHQVEAVCLVGDAGGEPGHGGERADDVLVCRVAGVTDPVVPPEAGEDLKRRLARGGFAGK